MLLKINDRKREKGLTQAFRIPFFQNTIKVYTPAVITPPGVHTGERGATGDVDACRGGCTPPFDALEPPHFTPSCAVDSWRKRHGLPRDSKVVQTSWDGRRSNYLATRIYQFLYI